MPNPRIERYEGQYAPTGAGTVNLFRITPAVVAATTQTNQAKFILGFSVRVQIAGTTTAAVSFGTTAGGVTSIGSTTDIAATVLGRKTTMSGADLAGNGVLIGGGSGATEQFLTATYTTGAVNPVIHWVILLINQDQALKLSVT